MITKQELLDAAERVVRAKDRQDEMSRRFDKVRIARDQSIDRTLAAHDDFDRLLKKTNVDAAV